ncbi:PSD1 and planctomycete cytochrome C domain-containing protein [Flavihumibacter sp. CACIAM 22H1]|uniref:PSD1 and planctomycete cytochrome C domain-containing protein n=1 Tax=Flavihumibacter sp. CACIAM 22H1 TaxID=1812911 RepID=UPI000AEAA629|nr:PSD1 and planctomycete cytochrome C domain-containing protein [Flavihumibacter sp. CACIAM 22H1]
MSLRILPAKMGVVFGSLVLGLFVFSRCGTDSLADLPDTVDFNYHVRPILVQKCYLCHGPDESSRKANLRLDTYEGATALLKDGGKAIDPGHAASSLLVERIYHKDPDMVMPTPESNLRLTEREMALLEKWIDQGAKYDPHWAFLPPVATPELAGFNGNTIDYFINKELEREKLPAAPKASRESLLRRAAFLLTGLPPTQEEQAAFLAATNDDAYPKMVDAYLASPRFGERWARHWMDIARYAETRGHEFDYTIQGAWRYRDYLVRAFNQDIPYDQLLKEQLAGDLLPEPRKGPGNQNESIVGTVFLTMTEGTHSPVDIRKDEADRIDNMIDVTGKAFLGLTISCARCHDHKFDPISAKDYYSFYGVMEGTRFAHHAVNQEAKKAALDRLVQVQDSIRQWALVQLKQQPAYSEIIPAKTNTDPVAGEEGTLVLGDFSRADLDGWKSDGQAFGQSTTLGDPVFSAAKKWIGIREGMASSRKIAVGLYGALRSPDFIVSTNFIQVEAAGRQSSIRIVIDNFQLIQQPIYGNLEQQVSSTDFTPYLFDVSAWKGHKAYIEVLPGTYENHVFIQRPDSYVDLRYAIAFNTTKTVPEKNRRIVQELNKRIKSQLGSTPNARLSQLLDEELALRAQVKDSIQFIYGVTDGFGKNSPVFVRGNHLDLSKEPATRQFLPAVSKTNVRLDVPGSGRLELANAILEKNNPLAARVMVNRIWHYLFGKGIVETVDNFGLQGKLPTHPALLDHLALEFQKNGYSIKYMVRKIMLSETFQRAVKPEAAAREKDPSNTWLSHFPLLRLEGEAIRDALLAVSGRLDTTMYGPPVLQHITSFMNGRGKPAQSGPLDGAGRRSIYLEVRRNFLDPMLSSFDRPLPFTSFGKRDVTNVPSQSLILLNDPFVVQEAARLQARMQKAMPGSAAEKIQWLYTTCFARAATTDEVEKGTAFVNQLTTTYKRTSVSGNAVALAWKDYIHSLFNLKEFIYLN